MKVQQALKLVLAPIVRFAIARGVRFPELSELMKQTYVETAHRFDLPGKRMTTSRMALLTGLQRRDLKGRMDPDSAPVLKPNPISKVIAHWLAAGAVRLDRTKFETMVMNVSKDMHPRTMLDEMLRLEVVVEQGGEFQLSQSALIASQDEATLLTYFATNLRDHANASVENLLAAPEVGPHLERAAHYNGLNDAAARQIEQLARHLSEEALNTLNMKALELQNTSASGASKRIRFGTYFYQSESDQE